MRYVIFQIFWVKKYNGIIRKVFRANIYEITDNEICHFP